MECVTSDSRNDSYFTWFIILKIKDKIPEAVKQYAVQKTQNFQKELVNLWKTIPVVSSAPILKNWICTHKGKWSRPFETKNSASFICAVMN
jgi:hypothetical protein